MLAKRTRAASMNANSWTRVAAGTRASAVDRCAVLASWRKRTISSPGIAVGAAAAAWSDEIERTRAATNTRIRVIRGTDNLHGSGGRRCNEPGVITVGSARGGLAKLERSEERRVGK